MEKSRPKRTTSNTKGREDPVETEKQVSVEDATEKSGRLTRSTVGSSDTSGIDARSDSQASTSGVSSGTGSRAGTRRGSSTSSAGTSAGAEAGKISAAVTSVAPATGTTSAEAGKDSGAGTPTSAEAGKDTAEAGKDSAAGPSAAAEAGKTSTAGTSIETDTSTSGTTSGASVTVSIIGKLKSAKDKVVSAKDKVMCTIRKSPIGAAQREQRSDLAERNPNLVTMLTSGKASTSKRGNTGRAVTGEKGKGNYAAFLSGIRTRSMTRNKEQQMSGPSSGTSSSRAGKRGHIVIKIPKVGEKPQPPSFESGDSTCDTVTTSVDSNSEELLTPDDAIVMRDDEQSSEREAAAAPPARRPRLTRQTRVTSEGEVNDEQDNEYEKQRAERKDKDDDDSSASGSQVSGAEKLN